MTILILIASIVWMASILAVFAAIVGFAAVVVQLIVAIAFQCSIKSHYANHCMVMSSH